MALSDDEQHRLDELEALCIQEDLAFVRRLRGIPDTTIVTTTHVDRRNLMVGVLAVVVGLVLVAITSITSWSVGVYGALTVILGASLCAGSIHREQTVHIVRSDPSDVFMSDMEELWRQRQVRLNRNAG